MEQIKKTFNSKIFKKVNIHDLFRNSAVARILLKTTLPEPRTTIPRHGILGTPGRIHRQLDSWE